MWELPEGWEWHTLGDVCEVNPRKPSLKRDESALTSFVPMAAVDEEQGAITDMGVRPYGEVKRGYTYFEENDVLFAKITPSMENGKSAIARGLTDGIGFGSTEFHRLRPGEQVIPKWIHLFVRRQRFRDEAASHFRGSVGQQRVPKEFLESHLIPVPPTIETQRRIVARIEELFSHIQEARRLRDIADEEAERLMDGALYQTFSALATCYSYEPLGSHQPFITSGPRHWAKYAQAEERGPLFLRVGNVGYARLNLEDIEFLDLLEDAVEERAHVQADDVLVTITGTIGRCAVVPRNLPEAYINQHTALVRLEYDRILPRYLMWFILSPIGGGQTESAAYGQTKPGLNLSQLRELKLPVPSLSEQQRVVAHIDRIHNQVKLLAKAQAVIGTEFDRLKESILSRAFRGQL